MRHAMIDDDGGGPRTTARDRAEARSQQRSISRGKVAGWATRLISLRQAADWLSHAAALPHVRNNLANALIREPTEEPRSFAGRSNCSETHQQYQCVYLHLLPRAKHLPPYPLIASTRPVPGESHIRYSREHRKSRSWTSHPRLRHPTKHQTQASRHVRTHACRTRNSLNNVKSIRGLYLRYLSGSCELQA